MEEFAAMVTEDIKAMLSEEWKKIAEMDANGIDQLKQWEYLNEKSLQFAVRFNLQNSVLRKFAIDIKTFSCTAFQAAEKVPSSILS